MIHLALFVISKGLFVIFPPQWMEINAIFLLFRLSILFLVLVLLTRMRTMLGMKPTINVNFSVLTGRANTLTTLTKKESSFFSVNLIKLATISITLSYGRRNENFSVYSTLHL